MAERDVNFPPVRPREDGPGVPLPPGDPVPAVTPEAYLEGFGEELGATLNLDNWRAGRDLDEEYRRIETEVRLAVEHETGVQRQVREEVHPRLAWGEDAPPGAGRHEVSVEEVAEVQRGLLFSGLVEGCDGTSQVHDTLALTIHQVGVTLVSYRGDRGTWTHRQFRRDLRLDNGDPVREVIELLERRGRRGGLHPTPRDLLSDLARRAVMSYGERAVLLRRSTAPWRMGHGNPAAYELLNAGGYTDFVIESIRVLRELIEGHQKFVFVSSEPSARHLLTIGQALHPLEYLIVGTLREQLMPFLEDWACKSPVTVDTRWDGEALSPEGWVRRFRDEVASKVVVGLYRATLLAPPQLFYAHVDHSGMAARIALADSVFQERRGFPLLIDLAHWVCDAVYGGGSLREMASAAYVAAGAPFRYQSERATREP